MIRISQPSSVPKTFPRASTMDDVKLPAPIARPNSHCRMNSPIFLMQVFWIYHQHDGWWLDEPEPKHGQECHGFPSFPEAVLYVGLQDEISGSSYRWFIEWVGKLLVRSPNLIDMNVIAFYVDWWTRALRIPTQVGLDAHCGRYIWYMYVHVLSLNIWVLTAWLSIQCSRYEQNTLCIISINLLEESSKLLHSAADISFAWIPEAKKMSSQSQCMPSIGFPEEPSFMILHVACFQGMPVPRRTMWCSMRSSCRT